MRNVQLLSSGNLIKLLHSVMQTLPLEMHPPVESSPDQRTGAVAQGVRVDDINDRSHHVGPRLLDPDQQRLKPVNVCLNMTVEEDKKFKTNTGLLKIPQPNIKTPPVLAGDPEDNMDLTQWE